MAAPGDLDTSFSGDGIIATDFAGGGDYGEAVVVDADGKVVVVGDTSTGSTRDVVVLRYLPDGSLDPGFSDDGIVTTSIGAIASVSDAAIDSAGRIVVATLDSTLLRYEPNGELDSTFGSSGRAATFVQQVRSIAIDTDDRIVVAGDSHVARYLSDGTIDAGFGNAGVVEVVPSFLVWAVAIDSQDRIVVAGSDFIDLDVYDGVVTRFLPDGAPDLSFANAGVALLQKTWTLWVEDLAVDSNDAILLAVSNGNVYKAPLMRLTSDGAIDMEFGTDGMASIQYAEQASVGSLAVDPRGNIVAAGAIEIGANDFDLLVVRYRPNGSPDTGFSVDGITTADAGNNRAGAGAVAIDADGGIAVAGSTSGDQNSDLVLLASRATAPMTASSMTTTRSSKATSKQ